MPGRILTSILALAYPALVFVTLNFYSVDALGWMTVIAGSLRLLISAGTRATSARRVDGLGLLLIFIGAVILTTQNEISARLYPAIVNLGVLGYFVWSLSHPPSAIERLARTINPELPDYAIAYTRRVTQIWCLFFLLNGSIALYTAFWSSLELWSLYNGFIAYLLIGSLLGIEYLVRRRFRRSHEVASD